ncbi:hypothetical protein ES703_52126 [subsurface metagenome]
MGLWYEKPEFDKWNKIVQELAIRIEERLDGEYEVKCQFYPKTPWKWKLYAPLVFARPRRILRDMVLRINTKKEYAINAEVHQRSGQSENGDWGEPVDYFDLDIDNAERLEEVASILAEVCRARHR